ncbi:hypothetical protein CCUS01_03002 [Colletotrichum cuscutae]|uniref:Uncharacterized protein n=1 Tax=Colletotrichum cuscutae TaxID=1209917 RepID=A0AAI9YAT7_9PEZI|nr:hypothetical protein CCUS01_03002 [Colletotrichum cuscutae]
MNQNDIQRTESWSSCFTTRPRADRLIPAFGGNNSVEGMNLDSRLIFLNSKRTYLLLFLLYRIWRKTLDITGRPSDRQSWSLGQIVALATWIPVVVEFVYMCICKSMLLIPSHDLSLADDYRPATKPAEPGENHTTKI